MLQTLIYRNLKDKAVEIEQVQIMCQSKEKLLMAGRQGELFRTYFFWKLSLHWILRSGGVCSPRDMQKTHQVTNLDLEH